MAQSMRLVGMDPSYGHFALLDRLALAMLVLAVVAGGVIASAGPFG